MTDASQDSDQQTNSLLRRLFKGLDNRHALPGGAARTRLDTHLCSLLAQLARLLRQPQPERLSGPPPRPLAMAMAMAVYSQPHQAVTFARLRSSSTEPVGDAPHPDAEQPVILSPEILEEALGVPLWELDDFREEVDIRAGRLLKQARALHWLWSRFGLPDSSPEPLFRVLFPGLHGRIGPVGLVRRGPQLYAVVDQDPAPDVASMYLSWLPYDEEKTFPPLGTFRGRYVDDGLRESLARSIGADDEETIRILDRLVTVVPRAGLARFVEHDRWRSSCAAAASGLADAYPEAEWLVTTLQSGDVDVEEWMSSKAGQLKVRSLRRVFDTLFLPRVTTAMRQVYAATLARVSLESPSEEWRPRPADLVLYDLKHHIKRAARPLMDWVEAESTANHVSEQLSIPATEADRMLEQVHATWSSHLDAVWCSSPRDGKPRSVQTVLTTHLIATQDSLRRAFHHSPLYELSHRGVLLLFAGHYFADAPLQRLWAPPTDDGSPSWGAEIGPDPVGRWFWPTWQRLMSYYDPEAITLPEPLEVPAR